MKNVDLRSHGDVLTTKVDLSKEVRSSSAGQMVTLATISAGDVNVSDTVLELSLNCHGFTEEPRHAGRAAAGCVLRT